MKCIYAKPDGIGGYHCGPGGKHAGKNASAGVCRECLGLPPPMRGLGDAVARMTTAVGIKPCGGCKKRQELLNRLVPFTHGKAKAAL